LKPSLKTCTRFNGIKPAYLILFACYVDRSNLNANYSSEIYCQRIKYFIFFSVFDMVDVILSKCTEMLNINVLSRLISGSIIEGLMPLNLVQVFREGFKMSPWNIINSAVRILSSVTLINY
jgi:hypothetical protein